MALVVIDAGHGGNNPGAVYQGRQEKGDVLALALAELAAGFRIRRQSRVLTDRRVQK